MSAEIIEVNFKPKTDLDHRKESMVEVLENIKKVLEEENPKLVAFGFIRDNKLGEEYVAECSWGKSTERAALGSYMFKILTNFLD